MQTKTSNFGLTGNQLKLIAMLLMTVDHVGAYLLPQYRFLRILGRLAMPVFAWMIAEGCTYSRNRRRYLLTIGVVALVCAVVNYLFMRSLRQTILVTFSMSVVLIMLLDRASKQKDIPSLAIMLAGFAVSAYICEFMPGDLPVSGFAVDYGFCGVLLPVLIYVGRNRAEKLMMASAGLAMVAMYGYPLQWYALLSIPLLALYNGQRGKYKLKYLFYLYYPLHLAAIYGVGLLLAALMSGGYL